VEVLGGSFRLREADSSSTAAVSVSIALGAATLEAATTTGAAEGSGGAAVSFVSLVTAVADVVASSTFTLGSRESRRATFPSRLTVTERLISGV
jgi:hypothetical protein